MAAASPVSSPDDPFPNLDSSDDEDVGNEGARRLVDQLSHDSDSALSEDDEAATGETNPKEAVAPSSLPPAVENVLKKLPPRWRNWFQRGASGILLISGFTFLINLGPAGLLFLTYLVVTSCYTEVMRLGYKVTGAQHLSLFSWALFGLQQYYFVGASLWKYWSLGENSFLIRCHEAVCFSLYLGLLVYFVLSLDTDYIKSYALLAWSHMTLFLFGFPGHLMNITLMEGMIWYVLPMTLITLNDIAAYYVGFFFGKTPLIKTLLDSPVYRSTFLWRGGLFIWREEDEDLKRKNLYVQFMKAVNVTLTSCTKLSPKKTLEGFVGGMILTVLLGTYISYLLITPYLVCPVVVDRESAAWTTLSSGGPLRVDRACVPNQVFRLQQMSLLGGLVTVSAYPFVVHGFVISVICSIVGPFGGLFGSGFKRACKRKNFGSFIPGHGGVTDRCDCMFLCAAIINFYYDAFIREAPNRVAAFEGYKDFCVDPASVMGQ